MMLKVTNRFLALLLVVFLVFFSSGITTASANNFVSSPQVIFIASSENTKDTITFSEHDLTPQERQKLQAVRQRRNKEILAVLDTEQQRKLAQYLHSGSDFNQAIEALDLNSEQQELINAIIDFTNLKLKGIFYQHELLEDDK